MESRGEPRSAQIPRGDRAGFTSLAAILRLLSHQHGEEILSSLYSPPADRLPFFPHPFLPFSLPLSLQFPVGRAPGFSRIEGSIFEGSDLKPLVRHERARTFSLSISPPPPLFFSSSPFPSSTLLSIHSRPQTTGAASFCVESIVLLGLLRMYIWSLIQSVRARDVDCSIIFRTYTVWRE